MAIQRWDPWQELRELEQRMNELTRRPLSLFQEMPWLWRTPTDGRAWMPSIEMLEKNDRYIVRAELPGMKKDDIEISLEDDTLTIKGERKAEAETKAENYYFREMSYGKFSRSITLPARIQNNKVEASYESGILEITLPKAEGTKARKVSVKVKEVKEVKAEKEK